MNDTLTEQQKAEIRLTAREVARTMRRPVLASAATLADMYDLSEGYVRRRCEELGIKKRDVHGSVKTEKGGPTRYSVAAWEDEREQNTRSVKGDLRRAS